MLSPVLLAPIDIHSVQREAGDHHVHRLQGETNHRGSPIGDDLSIPTDTLPVQGEDRHPASHRSKCNKPNLKRQGRFSQPGRV